MTADANAACATLTADAGHATSINADTACATLIADTYAAHATLIADAPAFASGTQQQLNLLLFKQVIQRQ